MRKEKTKKCLLWIVILVMGMVLSGCKAEPAVKDAGAQDGDRTKAQTGEEQDLTGSGEEMVENAETGEQSALEEQDQNDAAPEEMFCGEWTLAGWEWQGDEPEMKRYMAQDMLSEGKMAIYKEEGKVCADYYFYAVNYEEANGMKVVRTAVSDGNGGYPVEAKLESRWDTYKTRKLKLVSENELWYVEEGTGGGDYAEGAKYVYFRNGSSEQEHADDWRYMETVTVSDAQELLEEIGPNKKIILKEGIYNFSEVTGMRIENPYIETNDMYEGNIWIDTQYTIQNIESLCITAQEGAKVTICTELAYAPVLAFDCCSGIVLNGLTCGHEVEPGFCTGAALYASNSNRVTIQDCRLYGSGTYGIEMDGAWEITVEDTDIYDCTCGLVCLRSTSQATFTNCNLSDSSGFGMFELSDCYDLLWENCNITGNVVNNSLWNFIECYNSWDVTFQNCQFRNNSYEQMVNEQESDGAIVFVRCIIADE